MRHGLLVTFFGRQRDRFCLYQEPLTVLEKLELASKVPGATGVELIYPEECTQVDDMSALLGKWGLQPTAINANVKGHEAFVRGALSSPDPAVRGKAVDTIRAAKEFARSVGCPRVTCAPLSDGYDYPFQVDYRAAWKFLVASVQEAADYIPEVTLHLEHKPSDPRLTGLLATPAKVLRLCRDVSHPSLGITFNNGHSVFGGGWTAPEFALIAKSNVPCYVHLNDGGVEWDWDLISGSRSFWQLVEFLSYAKEVEYSGWFTADVLPLRQDPLEFFAMNIRITQGIWDWLGSKSISQLRETHNLGHGHRALRELADWVCQTRT